MKRPAPEKLQALSDLLAMDTEFLEACLRWQGEALEEPPPALAARLRRVRRLCRDLDLDPFAGSIIVELLERLEALRRDLEPPEP